VMRKVILSYSRSVTLSVLDWSTPVPDLFWEIYDRWISPSVIQALQVDLHERLIKRVPRGARLLDVGTGGGQHAVRVVRERPDLRVDAIDISATMVRRARALAEREGVADKLTFQQGDALQLPFDNASFDAVWCAGPLKQINDKPRALQECYRVLRPGGRLLIMDVNRGCSEEDVQAFTDRTTLLPPGRAVLKYYFSGVVARQSIDLDEVRALWNELPLVETDGPRRIPGHPAFVAVGTKPAGG
ncbi:MAG TPA: methyltransferase domain-containing protein, partial [Polyangiales bacterium]